MKTMLKVKSVIVLLVLLLTAPAFAQNAQVSEVQVKASKMSAPVKCTIILPEEYTDPECQEAQYPVLYLLHGYGGNNNSWVQKKEDLPDLASQYSVIIVCPDGRNSWYWDSPVNKESQYETFMTKDLIEYIDNTYRTVPEAGMRAITGLSMGGHGAMWLGLRHPDVFGSCGSTSGGVDFRPFPQKWKIKDDLGDYATHKDVWDSHTVLSLVPKINKEARQRIIFDCGTKDFFFEVNNNLHEALLKAGVEHDYIVRPGSHNWDYWNNSIDYQILFFVKSFGAN